jgi:hypothetical protein
MRNFNFIPFFTPCPLEHEELDPRVERFILGAARRLAAGTSETDVVAELVADGALEHEAVNAVRAGAILNE